MPEISCDGLLFDLDGVLVDSNAAIERVWSKWAAAHGYDSNEIVRRAHGRPSLDTLRELMPDGDYETENRVVLQGEIDDTEGVVAIAGARELLNALPRNRWAIVTSCSRPLAEVRLKAAGLPFPYRLQTSDDISCGKPDPEPYIKGAALLGFPPSRCVVFEDAPAGVRSGKAAGALVIALPTALPESELEEAGADWIISGYREIAVHSSDHGSGSLLLQINA
jgi:sugar-phosphatase